MPGTSFDERAMNPPPADPSSDKYASTVWGNGGAYQDLVVPSGQLCLVRKPGVEGLIQAGVLNDMDLMTTLVGKEHIERMKKGLPQPPGPVKVNVDTIMEKPELIERFFHVLDRVLCYVVVKPEIIMSPSDRTSRKQGVIYSDMVDMEDKLAIMKHAMSGQQAMLSFRQESAQPVGGVAPFQAVEMPTQ